ncbi:MAG: hypothetical protein CMO55_13755 [Verrucomicrobiales bacterium]|nr:hypothetical protein [Verrucomicrobiales bacterium]
MIVPIQKNKEFVEDFQGADNVSGAIHIWWLGQSSFLIKWNGNGLLIDPYLSDSVTRKTATTDTPLQRISEHVVDPLELSGIDVVLCSNNDPDRFDPETLLPLRASNPNLKVVVPAGNRTEAEELLGKAGPPILTVNAGTYTSYGAFDFHGITATTPKIRRDSRGNSKDLGFVIVFGPFSIYFSSATTWHTSLVKDVRRWSINLAILPINGGVDEDGPGETLNGFQAAALSKAISTSLVCPCHYDMFDVGNPTTEEFSSCCDRLGQRYRILKLGQRMTMGPVVDPSAGKAAPSEEHKDDWGLGY